MSKALRILGATILSALAPALLWSLPAIGNATLFLVLWIVNAAISLGLFVICGTLSHMILKWKRWTALRHYLGVMFAVATIVLMLTQVALLQWIFGQGGSEFHLGTQVIEGGNFTLGGLVLTFGEASIGAVCLTASFALFWAMTVRPPSQSTCESNGP